MSDWDVIAPVHGTNVDEEEEVPENYEYAEEEDFDQDWGSQNSGSSSPFRITSDLEEDQNEPGLGHPPALGRPRRQDRLAYKHKTGAGYRKPHLYAGHEIEDAMMAYNEGFHSYSNRTQELREATVKDLLSETPETRAQRDNIGGAGSKIITEYKVRRGSTRRRGAHDIQKSDIISTKTDQDVKHYFDHVSHTLMEEGAFVQAKYEAFRDNALAERESLGIGRSAEMNSLYCFWCYYLREHFNKEMYDQFLDLAREDVVGGSHYGIECFFRFCSYGLEMFWDPTVYEDFQNESMADNSRHSTYGLEKLKAFILNQKYDFPLPTKPDVEKELAKYPTLKSFKEQPMTQFGNKRPPFQPQPKPQRRQPKAPLNPQNSPRTEKSEKIAEKSPEKAEAKPEQKVERKPGNSSAPRKEGARGGSRGGRGGRGRGGNRGGAGGPRPSGGGWVFGRVQPASAPMGDSPMQRNW